MFLGMFVVLCLVTGCSSCSILGMFASDDYPTLNPETGKFKDEGRITGSEKRWLNSEIKRELDGKNLPAKGWNAFWIDTFKRIRQTSDNPDREIQYVIETRRSLGLPEISGESPGEAR
jgi:hypothetical protein